MVSHSPEKMNGTSLYRSLKKMKETKGRTLIKHKYLEGFLLQNVKKKLYLQPCMHRINLKK